MHLNSLLRQRPLFLGGLALCVVSMITALTFQYAMKLEPCPLCIMQRVFVIALGIVFLVAALFDPGRMGRRVFGVLIATLGVFGMAVAGRHVWLQNLPADQVPECGPGLEYLLDAFPLSEALSLVFRGSGECADVQWVFLGLTIPGWTLVVFTVFTLFGLLLIATRFAMPPTGEQSKASAAVPPAK
jgi:disulfide bond formation protein DsbB